MNGSDQATQPPVPTAARQRLPKAFRLDSAGFRSTFENGKSQASRLFVMWILRIQGEDVGRAGTVASKRTFHDAVQRNRARRLLREAYRTQRAHLEPGAQFVLLARRPILKATSRDVAGEFKKMCRKAGLWRETP
ncbi:MAG: ribonuclease P protein component [Kiritimatiellae bacterium]|nr:ribonuclease P protein component [Kiritimatiellia bacterium]MBR0056154.1 ribonuclease P protein component [Kiritimatiellia bacterium]